MAKYFYKVDKKGKRTPNGHVYSTLGVYTVKGGDITKVGTTRHQSGSYSMHQSVKYFLEKKNKLRKGTTIQKLD